jgi:hypothetical protein
MSEIDVEKFGPHDPKATPRSGEDDVATVRSDLMSLGHTTELAALGRIEAELLRRREALKKIKRLEPLYVRPSGGKDYHGCHFIAQTALSTPQEPTE